MSVFAKIGKANVINGLKLPQRMIDFYAGKRTCPPAGGAVPREDTTLWCLLTRALQVFLQNPHNKKER